MIRPAIFATLGLTAIASVAFVAALALTGYREPGTAAAHEIQTGAWLPSADAVSPENVLIAAAPVELRAPSGGNSIALTSGNRPSTQYPIHVNTGGTGDDASAVWQTRTITVAILSLILISIVGGLTWQLLHLQSTRLQFATIVENSNDAICSCALDGTILSWNRGAEKMFQFSAREIVGKSMRVLRPSGTLNQRALPGEILGSGERVEREFSLITKSGRAIDVVASFSPLRNYRGVICGASVIMQDCTERKRAEAARREADERMRLATQATGVGIWEWNLSTNEVRWCEQMFRLYGIAPTADGTVKYSDWTRCVAPEDLQAQEDILQDTIRRLGRGTREFRIRRADDDRERHIQAVEVVRVDADGRAEWVVGTNLDVTERKQSEATLRLAASVFDNALDGILIVDEHFEIVSVNRAFTAITGYPAAEVIGRHPRILRSYRHDEAFYRSMRQSINETGCWQGEIWDKRKNGDDYCEHLSISAVRNERGEITNYCGVLADITERKLAEQSVIRLNAELEDRVAARTGELEYAYRELESFSYSVSHDLRAPVRHIIAFAEMVRAKAQGLDDEGVGKLKKIEASAARMAQMIEGLLQLSRISRQPMNKQTVDLTGLACSAIEALAHVNPERDVEVLIQPGLTAEGDRGLLYIVLQNLLGNAWKFTSPADRPLIEFGHTNCDGEEVFFVRDNGAGFDMKYADKLFGAFRRMHTEQEFEGTGIGLNIVHRIVHRHGGRIWARAKPGDGATFFFTLPALAVESKRNDPA